LTVKTTISGKKEEKVGAASTSQVRLRYNTYALLGARLS
jgi:hypothetical protein